MYHTTVARAEMHTLLTRHYTLYAIVRDAGYTPRELAHSVSGREHSITLEVITPNCIAQCYAHPENVQKILNAMYVLYTLGVQPVHLSASDIAFRNGAVVLLTTSYSRAPEVLDLEIYSDIINELTSTSFSKRVRSEEAAMYEAAAAIGVAPEVLSISAQAGVCTLTARRYPYTLQTAATEGVRLTPGAKRALLTRMSTLHLLGILHCDITEENFVCDLAGEEALVIDFGLSVRLQTVDLDVLREQIQDLAENEDDVPGTREELSALATRLELQKLTSLLQHF